MLYGFLGDVIVGRLNIRHKLNEGLSRRGGHIGYAVAPVFRGKKFATEIMKQGLEYCRALGLEKILLTCADSNIQSWKIIENFGGILENTFQDDEDNELVRRYWIKV
jgi:predicted acetyltransferase